MRTLSKLFIFGLLTVRVAAQTVYVGNSLTLNSQLTYGPDGSSTPPLVILGEYKSSGPLAGASPATTLPSGTVQDVRFYAQAGEKYSFTLYALQQLWSWNGEQDFEVMAASQVISGTASSTGVQTQTVQNFPVNSGFLLAFAGYGPVYAQTANDAANSDATYSSTAGTFTATAPGGPGTQFTTGVYPNNPNSTTYEYIPDTHQNQGRTYAIGVDVATTQTVLYDSGAGFPLLKADPTPLAGQGGWQSSLGYSTNAAYVVGSAWNNVVMLFGPYVTNSGSGAYNAFFTNSLNNYNPVAAGDPVVSVIGDVCMNLGPTASQASYVYGWVILNDQNGNAFESIGVCANGDVCGQNFASPNQVVTAPGNGTNTYHLLRADLNFNTRQITFYMDGVSFGTNVPFNPNSGNLLGSVELVLQSSNPVDSNFLINNLRVVAHQVPAKACSINITSAGSCVGLPGWNPGDVPGQGTPGTPGVGDTNYGMYVNYTVTGTPAQPYFRFKYTLGNVVNFSQWYLAQTVSPSFIFSWTPNCDNTQLWSVTIDPDSVTGSSTPASMTRSGTFTPTPPTQAVESYDTRPMVAEQEATPSVTSGQATDLWMMFGWPTSHGAQNIISVNGPPGSYMYYDGPQSIPTGFLDLGVQSPGASFQETVTIVAKLSNMRVNPAKLESISWSQMSQSALGSAISEWLTPDPWCQSTDPEIANFVKQYLPANYQTTMTPYDTARALQRAVERSLIYAYANLKCNPATGEEDAVYQLTTHQGDCAGHAEVLAAALRNAGIPARRIVGMWTSDSWQSQGSWGGHERAEFYLPGAGWLVADATLGAGCDPTSIYTPDFCFVPDANGYFAMDIANGHDFVLESGGWVPTIPQLQTPDCSPGWGASTQVSLQPLAGLAAPVVSGGTVQLTATNMPSQGSVLLQQSKSPSSAATWTTVTTLDPAQVSNNGGWNYTFPSIPASKAAGMFYRTSQSP